VATIRGKNTAKCRGFAPLFLNHVPWPIPGCCVVIAARGGLPRSPARRRLAFSYSSANGANLPAGRDVGDVDDVAAWPLGRLAAMRQVLIPTAPVPTHSVRPRQPPDFWSKPRFLVIVDVTSLDTMSGYRPDGIDSIPV
jgi:hypothetical protein